MRFRVAFATFFATAIGLTAVVTAQQPVVFIDPAKVEAAWANAAKAEWTPCPSTSGVSAGPCSWFVNQPGLIVRVMRRERPDPDGAEVHERSTHVWYVIDGDATFITGGKLLGPKGALYIEGGQERQLRKGVIMMVPPGTPHMWKEVRRTLVMYQVNVELASRVSNSK